jgi:hypothetical protein
VYTNHHSTISHVPCVPPVTSLNSKSPVPQFHSLAFDASINASLLIVFAVFPTTHALNPLAVGATSTNVYVAVLLLIFPTLSITYHITDTIHVMFCAAIP